MTFHYYTPTYKYVVIPPTYEVYGGVMFSLFRLSVHTYVHSFVRMFVSVRVKVFALKFIRPHILKTYILAAVTLT